MGKLIASSYSPPQKDIARVLACCYLAPARHAFIYVDREDVIRYGIYTSSTWHEYNELHQRAIAEYTTEVYKPAVLTGNDVDHTGEREMFLLYSHFVGCTLVDALTQIFELMRTTNLPERVVSQEDSDANAEDIDPYIYMRQWVLPEVFFAQTVKSVLWYSSDLMYFEDTEGVIGCIPRILLPRASQLQLPDPTLTQKAVLAEWQSKIPENPKFIRSSTITKAFNRVIGRGIDRFR